MGERRGGWLGGFGELKAEREKQERQEIQELYDNVLKDNFDEVPNAGFAVEDAANVESIAINQVPDLPAGERQLSVTVNYRGTGDKPWHVDGHIFERSGTGMVEIKLPGNFPLTHEQLAKTVLKDIESMRFDFYHETSLKILPEKDEPAAGRGGTPERKQLPPIDRGRKEQLELLRNQPGVLFGVRDSDSWYNDYHVFLFRGGLVLESGEYGNAAYVVRFSEKLPVAQDPKEEEQREEIVDQYVRPIFKQALSRKQLQEQFAAKKVVHSGNWQGKLQEETAVLG